MDRQVPAGFSNPEIYQCIKWRGRLAKLTAAPPFAWWHCFALVAEPFNASYNKISLWNHKKRLSHIHISQLICHFSESPGCTNNQTQDKIQHFIWTNPIPQGSFYFHMRIFIFLLSLSAMRSRGCQWNIRFFSSMILSNLVTCQLPPTNTPLLYDSYKLANTCFLTWSQSAFQKCCSCFITGHCSKLLWGKYCLNLFKLTNTSFSVELLWRQEFINFFYLFI